MQGRKLIITSLITILAGGGGLYLYNIAKKSPKEITDSRKSKPAPFKKLQAKKGKGKNPFERHERKRPRTKKNEWKEIGNYPHKDKITKHFQRFRKRKKNKNFVTSPPSVELKLGKVFEKKHPKKTFKIREVLVTIDGKNGKRNFVAMVNEDTGKIIKKQGRRITDHLRKIGRQMRLKK